MLKTECFFIRIIWLLPICQAKQKRLLCRMIFYIVRFVQSTDTLHMLIFKQIITLYQLSLWLFGQLRSILVGCITQIRFENISKLPILIADSNTETAFVTLLHAAYNQIEHNNSENKKLSELRNSLLPQLMSGKIDVSRIRL